ncbi:MAG: ComF family protein [Gloeomargarita sp. GMQP_bins_120]
MWRPLLSTVFHRACPLCRRPAAGAFCRDCQRQVTALQLPQPWRFWQEPLPMAAWGCYRDALKRVLGALKYQGKAELARPLGHYLGDLWLTGEHGLALKPAVVPIPLHAAKLQKRGYNQAELLARHFCQYVDLPLYSDLLVRQTETQAQHQLSPVEREANLAAAFACNGRSHYPRRPVLLLDDIYTTGATARAAQRVLQQAGWSVVGILVVATGR